MVALEMRVRMEVRLVVRVEARVGEMGRVGVVMAVVLFLLWEVRL